MSYTEEFRPVDARFVNERLASLERALTDLRKDLTDMQDTTKALMAEREKVAALVEVMRQIEIAGHGGFLTAELAGDMATKALAAFGKGEE